MTNFLGVDIGRKRIGLSVGDMDLMLALPIPALIIAPGVDPAQGLAQVTRERAIDVVVFGYPVNMDDTVGKMADYVDMFIDSFRKYVSPNIKIVRSDERLTSQQAETERRNMRGKRFESAKRKRDVRDRGVIDSHAAAIILQDYIDELIYGMRPSKPTEE